MGLFQSKGAPRFFHGMEELGRRIQLNCPSVRPETLAKVWDDLKLCPNYLKNVNFRHKESLIS